MDLVYPMFAMIILTALVGISTAYHRIKSAYSGEIDPRYFKLLSGYEITDKVAKLGRNFDNLFEVPVLFYAASTTALALNLNTALLLALAWGFVVLRIFHTLIHISYNHPLHRFLPFFLSFLCTVIMWVEIVIQISG